jgi:hypothetical protein
MLFLPWTRLIKENFISLKIEQTHVVSSLNKTQGWIEESLLSMEMSQGK